MSFFDRLILGWSGAKDCYIFPHETSFHGEVEVKNVMKAETSGLVMVLRIFAAMRNWLGDSGFIAAVCKWKR
jgi:hypothetical protein